MSTFISLLITSTHLGRSVVQVQQQVNRSLCEGDPGYDEGELWDEFAAFLESRGEEAEQIVNRRRIFKTGTKGPFLGGVWPMMEEVGPEDAQEDQPAADPPLKPEPSREDVLDPPYFVSISRRSDFRRLRKNYCCGVMPGQCYKVEWVHEVKSSTADAHCKHCLKFAVSWEMKWTQAHLAHHLQQKINLS